MADVIITIYLMGWPLSSLALAVASRLTPRRLRPAPRVLVPVIIAAGGLWPLLVLGIGQFAGVMAISKALADDDAGFAVAPTAVEEFV